MCDHLLGSLPCTNTNHHPGENDDTGRGCIHISATGSDVDDRHTEGGHG